ncbi:MAG: hypothetical protein IPH62_02140 [Ignavibacteriae bacterium]|nr:hypothetical protein [Ignavibacteriota bacterium]
MLKKYLPLFIILLFQTNLIAQFKIDQLPSDLDQLRDSLFLGITKTRTIQNLNNSWKVFFVDEPENFSEVSFPLKFTSQKTVIFEKEFSIAADKLAKNLIQLNFLGLNYSAEIFLNNATIYKHAGGEIPFTIDLAENLLNYDVPNILRIKIQYDLNSESTIPLLQRFLFPTNFGGIFRDVYLSFKPKLGIREIFYKVEDDVSPYKNKIDFTVELENLSKIISDSTIQNYDGNLKLQTSVKLNFDTSAVFYNIWNITPNNRKTDFSIRLQNVVNWNPKLPRSYVVTIKLTNNSGYVFDEYVKSIALPNVKKSNKSLTIGENTFIIKGVTYIRSNIESVSSFKRIEKDIKAIKEAGFNTVRFSRSIPHPYAVYLCEKYGMFSLLELPVNSVPENFTNDINFRSRANSYLSRTIKYYDKFNTVIAYGAGGSYIRSSKSHSDFITSINKLIKSSSQNKLTYSSFIGNINGNVIDGLDLYGIEIYDEDPALFIGKYSNETFNDSSFYFISEATYPTYKGGTNGYLNNFSFEGQAKFFDGIIDITNESNLKGFVLNSMFDFKGDFAPFYAGFNKENNYSIGILSQNEDGSRLSYNVIKSRLTSESKTSIPIGNSSEDAPLIFIIAALLNSIIIALLINSKRKFREDTTRALLRPYNFYADIRDQRILTGFHSNILMFLLAGSNALLLTIILYHLKSNILFEKIIIAFGSYKFSSIISYLAWNPEEAFVYLYIATITAFILLSFIYHASSFFVKTRVLFSSVYSVAIWAFLPLALLVPVETILYKILQMDIYNYIIYGIIILFIIWNIQRFLKGIYVIFDVRPFFVYLFSFSVFFLITFILVVYLQYFTNTIDYISLALKQFSLL